MNLKSFKLVCKVASFLLKVLGFFAFILVPVGLILVLFTDAGASFTLDVQSSGQFLASSGNIGDTHHDTAALIVAPPFFLVFGYVMWKGSQLFDQLIEGHSPFSVDFRTT